MYVIIVVQVIDVREYTIFYLMGLDFLSVIETGTDHFKKRLKGFVVWKIVNI